jgi:hypothetical protein
VLSVAVQFSDWLFSYQPNYGKDDQNRYGKRPVKGTVDQGRAPGRTGEMAAGFAHEINNPLQIIKSEQALIKYDLSELG